MSSPTDLQGRPWLTFTEAKPGTAITFDGDFTCIKKGAVRTAQRDTTKPRFCQLWFRCNCGRHYLDGQKDFDGGKFYVGIYHSK